MSHIRALQSMTHTTSPVRTENYFVLYSEIKFCNTVMNFEKPLCKIIYRNINNLVIFSAIVVELDDFIL